ncbi:MAG: prepilin-type N-terminal cleavage/methylation domain-containing protein [Burkholderiales bacterium]|nr:prepilin-type N-terminal cleavage/methylation domain-containing protein [Burkholderiales bacterium]
MPAYRARRRGFTLIELLVVMAIIGLLVSIAAPRYFHSVERARESSLQTSLNVMRDAIDKYLADQGHYPKSLDELAERRYLRSVPEDPMTSRRDSWVLLPPAPESGFGGEVADVRSGAAGRGRDGRLYADW